MRTFYTIFLVLFAFCMSESSFAARGNRSSNRSDSSSQSKKTKARRGSSQRKGGTGRVAVGTSVNRTRLLLDTSVKKEVVEEEVEEETLPEIEEIEKVTSFKKYTSDINELITRISTDTSRLGIGGVKRYSYSSEKCVSGFEECSMQNSVCGKNFSSCLDSSEIELEEKTWFCQKTLMKKCAPDTHESMFDQLVDSIEKTRVAKAGAKAEADRLRADRLAEKTRRDNAAAIARQKQIDETAIYALACENAGGAVQNEICLVGVTLQYPGGTADTSLPTGERAYCNATTFGYDPINKMEVKQKKNRAWVTTAGVVAGAAGGALIGNSIENNMEEKADDFEETLDKAHEARKDIKKNKAAYLGKCEEAGIRKKKCEKIVNEYIDDNYDDEDADEVDEEIEEFADALNIEDYEKISDEKKQWVKDNLATWKELTKEQKKTLEDKSADCENFSCRKRALKTAKEKE